MSRACSIIWLATNGIGTLLCLSAIVAFGILGNFHAVIWCVIACVLAASNTFIRAVQVTDRLENWYTLKAIASIRDFGMCVTIIALGFFTFTLFEIIYYQESLHGPISNSKIIVAVWCFISAKYAFTLFWVGRKYLYHLSETRNLLLDE